MIAKKQLHYGYIRSKNQIELLEWNKGFAITHPSCHFPVASGPAKAINNGFLREEVKPMAEEPGKAEEGYGDSDEWYGGEWCKICALTIGMAKLGWCDWQKELKECPKLLTGKDGGQNKKLLGKSDEELVP